MSWTNLRGNAGAHIEHGNVMRMDSGKAAIDAVHGGRTGDATSTDHNHGLDALPEGKVLQTPDERNGYYEDDQIDYNGHEVVLHEHGLNTAAERI